MFGAVDAVAVVVCAAVVELTNVVGVIKVVVAGVPGLVVVSTFNEIFKE